MTRTPDDIPPEVVALLTGIWAIDEPLVFALRPRDAWTVLGIVQFASRHPELSPTQLQLMQSFGRQLQQAIAVVEPALLPYLEMGWDPQYDVPRE